MPTDLLYSSQIKIRFDEFGHCYVWTPYNANFVAELKATFNSPEVRASYVFKDGDPGAEWEPVLECWIVHTGWNGCEHWIDILEDLLSKHYPK
jgi:hypothetical protein